MVTKRRISRVEQAKELQLMHAAGDDAGWGRPDTDTVNAVWRLVAPTLPAPLKHLVRNFSDRQVLTVALLRCIQVGEEPDGKTKRQQQRRRTISRNHLFDSIAPKWSRTFKSIAEDGHPGLVPTRHVSDLRRESAEETRRELLAVGVRLADVWKIVAGDWSRRTKRNPSPPNPFFYLTRPNAKLGYRVRLRDTEALVEVRRLLRTAPDRSTRLLLDADPWPPRVDRYQICAERPFNGVEEDETVLQVLETMERARLRFHVRRFITDYDRWKRIVERVKGWKARVPHARRTPFPRRVKIARRLQIDLDTYRQVREQVEGLPDEVLIKSRVFRDQEGRFHARHFWPQHVSGKHTIRRPGRGIFRSSRRERWFSDRHGWPLSGYDVAGSQTQILAVLLGLTDLEALTQDNYFTTKHYLAAQAMARLPLRGTPSSAELVRVMKDLWTRVLYGGHIKEIVWDHFDLLVPGAFTRVQYLNAVREAKRYPTDQQWAARARTYNDALKRAEQNLLGLLEDIPWYGKKGEEQLSDFFRACKQFATSAMQRDIYAGVTFTDPLAGTLIQWNPPRRQRVRLNCQGFQVGLRLPGGWSGARGTPRRRFIDAIPHSASGDYPVSSPKLKQAVAPGVIHLLDALFNALVVQALERAGVVDFIALHDCWLVPAVITQDEAENGVGREDWHSQKVLLAAIEQAGRAWLERLGPIYSGLVDALQGTEFEPWMRRLQAEWEQRVREEKWPDFRVEPVVGRISLAWERVAEPVLAKLRRFNVSQSGEEPTPEDPPPF